MDVTIRINCDNAAFEELPGAEVARILRRLSEFMEFAAIDPGDKYDLRDLNGNKVGTCEVKE
jgi:hypothetical protein